MLEMKRRRGRTPRRRVDVVKEETEMVGVTVERKNEKEEGSIN